MKYGYFDNINREYVIENPAVPVSWTNYLGVKDMCAVISQNAGGYLFYKKPQYNRITRFRPNSVPMDRPGHYVYLRDDESKDYWTISWQPVGKALEKAKYECRHGLSYSKFSCDYSDIVAEQILFIPVKDDVELWDVKIKNNGTTTRKLSVFSYVEFSFQNIDMDNQNFQMSLYAAGSSYAEGVIENDLFYDTDWTGKQYITSSFEPDSYDCLRDKFLGNYHTEGNPMAVEKGSCSGSSELGGNHCGALHKKITLAPGESTRVIFMVGIGDRAKGKELKTKYSKLAEVDKAFAELSKYWSDKLSVLQIKTPNEGMNTMINTWNLYQAETNVMFSRFASFIEVGGRTGLGYRDTAQDVMCIPHTNPKKCHQRIIELLRGQTNMGYGLHLFQPEWFDPEVARVLPSKSPTVVPTPNMSEVVHGIKDACSDDALWLVASICEYVEETGEVELFEEMVTFADGGKATVYDHIKRILDFSTIQVGATGICKGLRADWNDCLNLGGGESSLVSFLHFWALNNFVEAANFLHRTEDAKIYAETAEKVKKACESELWDGKWYIRGITAAGEKIGTQKDEEGKVHLESNTWAVISDAAAPERAKACMDAVDEYLYSDFGLHLNSPSFSKPNDGIGFLTRVYKGVKENGAIFSHPNPWAWVAECKLGRGDRAMKFYNALLPYNQNDKIEIREAEPYSYCQFIMGRDHTAFGRARHPWLTGSAGWAYYAATHYILGVRFNFEGMLIDPCIPGEWKHFEITRKWRGATYKITVQNPNGVQKGVKKVTLNGIGISGVIKPQLPGAEYIVIVTMG